jgi:hypothetical protein
MLNPVRFAREALGFEPDPPQATVLSATTKRGILNCTRQWGKSTVTAAKAVHRAWAVPQSLILVSTPGERQSELFLEKASPFVQRLGYGVRGDGHHKISLLLPNGSRIIGLPADERTIRGFSNVALLLIDEAAQVSQGVYDTVRPVMAVSRGEMWLMSTPHGRQGFFFEEWHRAAAGWTRIAVPATECPRIPRDFLDEQRRTMTDRVFRQEYLCEFTETEQSVFREDLIRRAIRPDIKPLFKK